MQLPKGVSADDNNAEVSETEDCQNPYFQTEARRDSRDSSRFVLSETDSEVSDSSPHWNSSYSEGDHTLVDVGEKDGCRAEETCQIQGGDDGSLEQWKIGKNGCISPGHETANSRIRRRLLRTSEICLPPCMFEQNPEQLELLMDASRVPPVTKDSLSELNLDSIQNNLNLRIDICYDHDLYFQPISGRKGDVKRKDSEVYWSSIATELFVYQHDYRLACPRCVVLEQKAEEVTFEPRLKVMFWELRLLLETLVPESDREEVDLHLDIELIMQQIYAGALDIVRLSGWLARLLTTHCAPMRDEMAREMEDQLTKGALSDDIELLVDGLEKLFSLLEAMKLDVANHQIRTFRWPLIEDTVPFQIDCFQRMRDTGKLDLRAAKRWFDIALQDLASNDAVVLSAESRSFGAFVSALARLCDPEQSKLPIPFHYDKQRFARLQDDVADLIQLQICLDLFDSILERRGVRCNRAVVRDQLSDRILRLIDDDENNSKSISDNIEIVGIEIARFVVQMTGQSSQERTLRHSWLSEEVNEVTKSLQHSLSIEQLEKRMTKDLIDKLGESTHHYALQFLPMSTLEISNVQRQWVKSRMVNGRHSLVPSLNDMARRLAHIGVVHWKVWSDLVYLADAMEVATCTMACFGDDDDYEQLNTNCDTALSIEMEQTTSVLGVRSSESESFRDRTSDQEDVE